MQTETKRLLKSIYVGNLPFRMKREEITALFEPYGEVYSVKLIVDRQSGKPKGFGFVEMDAENIPEAIQAMNGQEVMGRKLVVNFARTKDLETAAV